MKAEGYVTIVNEPKSIINYASIAALIDWGIYNKSRRYFSSINRSNFN